MRYLIVFLIFMAACSPRKEKEAVVEKHIVILPEADSNAYYYSKPKGLVLINMPLFIGIWRDTIDLDKREFTLDTFPNPPGSNSPPLLFKKYTILEEHKIMKEGGPKEIADSLLEIFIDTNSIASDEIFHLIDYVGRLLESGDFDSIRNIRYTYYPVLISNNSNDSIFFYTPQFYLEAQSSDGNWNTISYVTENPKCTVGEPVYFVAPGEILILPAIICSGNRKTIFRWRLEYGGKKFYSNEYSGSLNSEL